MKIPSKDGAADYLECGILNSPQVTTAVNSIKFYSFMFLCLVFAVKSIFLGQNLMN